MSWRPTQVSLFLFAAHLTRSEVRSDFQIWFSPGFPMQSRQATFGSLTLYRETKFIIGFDFAVTPSSLASSCVLAQGHLGSDGTLQQCVTVGSRRFVCCGFALRSLLALSSSHLFVGSLIPGEVRERGRSLVEITSSDPISVSTPVLPRTVPDVDTVTDSEYVVSALNSIDALLAHPRKRKRQYSDV